MKLTLPILLILCISLAAHATADGPDYYRVSSVTSGSLLNLRAEPGPNGTVLARIPAGATCLRNLGCQGGLTLEEFTTLTEVEKQQRNRASPRWCKVEYRSTTGWVSGEFLAEAPCTANWPQQGIVNIELPAGQRAITHRDRILGREFMDYRFTARAGQSLNVKLEASHSATYFNLLPPDSPEAAMYIGQIDGNHFNSQLPVGGEYTVRVYLMRSAARRNAASHYRLDLSLHGDGLTPLTAEQDAVLPGTPYHASTTINCTLPYAPETRECDARVIRYGFDGTATVEVRGPAAYLRRILFIKGTPVATDATRPMHSTRQPDDITVVQFESNEVLKIFDALLTGG